MRQVVSLAKMDLSDFLSFDKNQPAEPLLEFKAGVFLSAARTRTEIHHPLSRVKISTMSAAECRLAPLHLKTGVITMIVIQPDAHEYRSNEQAINKSGDLKGHGEDLERRRDGSGASKNPFGSGEGYKIKTRRK